MKMFYSPNTAAFYPELLRDAYDDSDTWPEDAIEVTDHEFTIYSGTPPVGMIRGTVDDRPGWVSMPEPTKEEKIVIAAADKRMRLSRAREAIQPLQDAVDIGVATDDEASLLKKWKQYSVAVNRIDTDKTADIAWPPEPVD